MSDTTKLIGKLIEGQQERDAIHIAVAPVVAGEVLRPGQHVGFERDGDTERVIAKGGTAAIGIVDPFLDTIVHEGQPFWMFLYPMSIASLRHSWTHPAFNSAKVQEVATSKAWLEAFAAKWDIDCGYLIEQVAVGNKYGPYVCFGNDNYPSEEDHKADLIRHVEVVTGKRLPDERRAEIYFRCAC